MINFDIALECSNRNAAAVITYRRGVYTVDIIETEGPSGRGSHSDFNNALRIAFDSFDAKLKLKNSHLTRG